MQEAAETPLAARAVPLGILPDLMHIASSTRDLYSARQDSTQPTVSAQHRVHACVFRRSGCG